jgi:predicted DNA-binding protein (MmcQ/YjbR family)
MSKTHWNTVWLGGDVLSDEPQRMIEHSYDLIKPKVRKR